MYPFLVLDLPHDTTDRKVAKRYQELVERYPPDRAPEVFMAIRRAYEALRDERSRLDAILFYFDGKGSSLRDASLPLTGGGERRRLEPGELARLLRRIDREERRS